MATVTLSYQIRVGLQSAANLLAKISDIVLNTGELDLLGMVVASDTSVIVTDPDCEGLPFITRTVVLETNEQGDALFPNSDALVDATRNLWRSRLNLLIPGIVTSSEPVVT
jgi:hypothetical protein